MLLLLLRSPMVEPGAVSALIRVPVVNLVGSRATVIGPALMRVNVGGPVLTRSRPA